MNYYPKYSSFYSSVSISTILFFLLSSITLVGLESAVFITLAKFLAYILVPLLLMMYIFKVKTSYNIDFKIISLFLLFIWMFSRSINSDGLILSLQAFFLLLGSFILYQFKSIIIFDVAFKVSTILFITLGFLHFFSTDIYNNTNYIGVCALIFFIISMSNKTLPSYFLSFLCLLIVLLSGTRSALLGIFVAIFLYKILTFNLKLKLFFLAVLAILIYLLMYYGVYDYLNSADFAQLVIDKTGKRLESGRFDIWNEILSSMSLSDYIIGLGGGTNYSAIIGNNLSAHSGYIYILSSYGVIGLSLFVIALFFSGRSLLTRGKYYSFILFIALVFREFFEVTLINNSFPIALLFWSYITNGFIDKPTYD